ncbi:cysteine/serine-rich nuclear protein 1 [Cloeon dipterum]|uniref:cysteine/serine-rich nuclear protein 1 n=1 Tax=Cloeon dipterum TaxID=197152 RepID=UPI00321F9279
MEQREEQTLLEPDRTQVPPETAPALNTAVNEEGSSSCDATVGTEEEDERTEPLDRCSDGSDSGLGPDEEGRASNDSTSNASDYCAAPHEPLPASAAPNRSSLKRRREETDVEGCTSPKAKKKRSISFHSVTVFYFPRSQGFTCVPSQGGSTLGMATTHSHVQNFSLLEHATEQRRHQRQMMLQLRNQRLQKDKDDNSESVAPVTSSSSEDSESEEEASEMSDSELDQDPSYYTLQPVSTRQRRNLLRAAGVHKIDSQEKDLCKIIRKSREICGCNCDGYCDPDTCTCSRSGIKCQVDRPNFPCSCTRDGCANSAGRIEFNLERVRTHFIQTLMRLEMEKKEAAEQERRKQVSLWGQNSGGELPSASGLLAKHSVAGEKPGLHHVSLQPNIESCVHSGNYSTTMYGDQSGRADALPDLYSFRDQEEENFTAPEGLSGQQKNHVAEYFGSSSSSFSFDYDSYNFNHQPEYHHQHHHQHLNHQQQGQFGFDQYQQHYQQHNAFKELEYPSHYSSDVQLVYTNEEVVDSKEAKYTSLHNALLAPKLEPFSELVSVPYSQEFSAGQELFHNHHQQQQVASYEAAEGLSAPQPARAEEVLDDNFGEIIKKSMVETVSA